MYLIYDVTSPHGEFMRIYGWEILVLCHYAGETCDDKHCDGGNKTFLIFSHKHMFKGSCEFIGGSPSW